MPTFQNPVVEPDDAIQDEKLIGEWRAIDIKEDGTVETIIVIPEVIVEVDFDSEEYDGTVTTTRKETIVDKQLEGEFSIEIITPKVEIITTEEFEGIKRVKTKGEEKWDDESY